MNQNFSGLLTKNVCTQPFSECSSATLALVLQKHRKLRHQKEGMGLFLSLVCYQPWFSLHYMDQLSFSTRLAKYTGITGVEGSEKLKNHLTVLVCRVSFEEWIAARPQDTLTWKIRELTQTSLLPVQLCFSPENENRWSIAGLQTTRSTCNLGCYNSRGRECFV